MSVLPSVITDSVTELQVSVSSALRLNFAAVAVFHNPSPSWSCFPFSVNFTLVATGKVDEL